MNVEFLITLALFILGFGFLIFVHELGHFLVAKSVGVRCPQFAIGFGTAMVSWRKGIGFRLGSTEAEYERRAVEGLKERGKDPEASSPADHFAVADEMGLGETEYRLNYLPLGGYVKMVGQEDLDPAARSDDPRAFNKQPIWARTLIISAGVVMNIIFGWVFLVIAFLAGVQFPAAVIGDVAPGAPAATTYPAGHQEDPRYLGFQVGDVVTHIDGDPVKDWTDLLIATALGDPGEPIEYRVQRDGVDEPLNFTITPKALEGGLLSIGVGPSSQLTLGELDAEFESLDWLRDAGVTEGMTITKVNGEPVADLGAMRRAVDRSGGSPASLTFTVDGREEVVIDVPTLPTLEPTADGAANLLGLVPGVGISEVVLKSPAEQAGIRAGDVILRMGDTAFPSSEQVLAMVKAAGSGGGEGGLDVELLRGDEVVKVEGLKPGDEGRVGIGLQPDMKRAVVSRALAGSPAADAEMNTPGMEVVAVNGSPVAGWGELQQALQEVVDAGGEAAVEGEGAPQVELTYRLLSVKDQPEYQATLRVDEKAAARLAAAGWGMDLPGGLVLKPLLVRVSGGDVGEASMIGVEKTYEFVVQTYLTIVRLFQGSVGVSDLRGPVGIVDEGTKIAARGWPYMLFFLGLISVNLAVINFLPIPITDGGHILFLLIEKVKGSPVGPTFQTAATVLGLVLLGALVLTTTFYDVSRIVGNLF